MGIHQVTKWALHVDMDGLINHFLPCDRVFSSDNLTDDPVLAGWLVLGWNGSVRTPNSEKLEEKKKKKKKSCSVSRRLNQSICWSSVLGTTTYAHALFYWGHTAFFFGITS